LSLLNKLALVIMIVLLLLRIKIIIPAVIGGAIALLYGKTISMGDVNINIKKIPGGKIILVSMLWIVLIVFFPVVNEGLDLFSSKVTLLIVYFFLIIFTIIVISDIKDIKGDSAEGINTLAVRYGATKVRNLSILTLLLSIAPGYYLYDPPILASSTILLLLLVLFHDKLIR